MSARLAHDVLLDTIHYLELQKSRGVRFLRMDPEMLEEWQGVGVEAAPGNPIPPPQVPSFRAAMPAPPRKTPMTSDQRAAFEKLRQRAQECVQCPHLVKFRHQVVFGVGNPDAELMFVGEAPGADEDLQGEPFVGRAGQLLTKLIQTMGFQRADVFIANVLKCRPDVATAAGNRKPTPEEMATCIPYLKEQIQLIRPRALVALGDTAVKGLRPELKEGITKLRGRWMTFDGIPLMPTFHPAYLLRNPSLAVKRQCWEDMLAVMERLQRPISEKQRNFFLSASPAPRPA